MNLHKTHISIDIVDNGFILHWRKGCGSATEGTYIAKEEELHETLDFILECRRRQESGEAKDA